VHSTVRGSFFVVVPALTAPATDAGGVTEISAAIARLNKGRRRIKRKNS